MLSFPIMNDHIFSIWIIIGTYRERLKNIWVQCRQCSAMLFWNRSRDCSVCTTLEDGVLHRTPAQVFQGTWFQFCLFGVKRTAKSCLPHIWNICWFPVYRWSLMEKNWWQVRPNSGLTSADYDVRLKINILFVEWWGLCPHIPASFASRGYLIIRNRF